MQHYRKEVFRKLFHLTSLWIPASIWLMPYDIAFNMILMAFLAVTLFEMLRRQRHPLAKFLNHHGAFLMRDSEISATPALTGAFFMLLAAVIMMILCHKDVSIVALTILMISDSVAALIGKKWGRIHIAGKTLEGSVAFLLSALVIIYILHDVAIIDASDVTIFVISAIGCTAAEFVAKKCLIDDNLLIPLTFAGIYYSSFKILV